MNPASGSFTHENVDVSIPGVGIPLTFRRTYYSGSTAEVGIGVGWRHNWAASLEFDGDHVIAHYPQGFGRPFVRSGEDFIPRLGTHDELVENLDGSYTLTTDRQVEYDFDENGRFLAVRDRNGNETTLAYDGNGYLESVTDPGGRSLDFTVDGSGRIVEIEDPLARTIAFAYNGSGELVTVTTITGGTTTYTYGAFGLVTITDANNHTQVTNIYDSAGRVVEQADALGNTQCYYYGTSPSYTSAGCPGVSPAPSGRMTVYVDQEGYETTHEFDALYRLIKVTDAEGGVTEFAYDAQNNLIEETNPLDETMTYTYDANGNVLTRSNDLNHTWTYTYNSFNDVLTKTDPLSNVTTYSYDGSGNLATMTNHLSQVTTFTVNGAGLITEIEDPNLNSTTFGYDQYGNRTTVTNALNKTWTNAYDLGGRVTSVTDPLSHVTTFTHDDANRVLTETNYLSEVTTYTYDSKGNRTSVLDAEGNETTFEYDEFDRLVLVTDPLLNETAYAYDDVGNRTSLTNARGKTTTYTYDGMRGRLTVADPNSEVTTYEYDLGGRLATRADARGLVTEYTYDGAGRMTTIEYYDGVVLEATVAFTYDAVGNMTQMIDETGTTTYVYDDLHRLASVTAPTVGAIAYTYDAAGNRETVTYPDSSTVAYAYDAANQLVSVTDWLSNVTSYVWDDAGNLSTTELPNGIDADYVYDDADRLLSVTNADSGGTISSFTYTLDQVGNRVQMVDDLGTHSYILDDLYRLTEVTYPGPVTDTYTYDDLGNRLTKNADDYVYDDADQLTEVDSVLYDFDENGNLLERGSDTFTWDHENRLVESVVASATTSYAYNGIGLRSSRTVGMTTTHYAWDVTSALPVLLDDGTYRYVYGLDLIAAIEDDDTEHYFLYDGLGSVTEVTDDAGDVTASFRYDVFGAVRSSSGSTDPPWRFTGEQEDGETGLYFLRARYYDPSIGRFLSRDLVEFPQRYAYVDNNPMLWTDPSGMCKHGLPCPKLLQWAARKSSGSPLLSAISGVIQGARYCVDDFSRYVPGVGECQTRLELAAVGSALTIFGLGGAVIGCTSSATVLGPPTAFTATIPGCALSFVAGGITAYAGATLVEAAFSSWSREVAGTGVRSATE